MIFWYLHIIFQWITDSYMFILFLRMISDWYIMLVRRRPGSIFATVTQAVYASLVCAYRAGKNFLNKNTNVKCGVPTVFIRSFQAI